jgi:hypothetical protein
MAGDVDAQLAHHDVLKEFWLDIYGHSSKKRRAAPQH